MVPLGTLLDVKRVQGSELITRYNLHPTAALFGSAAPGFSSGEALSLMEQLARDNLPPGISYDWTSTSYQEKQAGRQAYFIVEFARNLHNGGMSIAEAAIEATRRRFRPIVMTSFAFIVGVAPLLIAFGAGAASQRAIGTVVFGGMLSSTLLAIPFVPVFYVIFARMSERRRKN